MPPEFPRPSCAAGPIRIWPSSPWVLGHTFSAAVAVALLCVPLAVNGKQSNNSPRRTTELRTTLNQTEMVPGQRLFLNVDLLIFSPAGDGSTPAPHILIPKRIDGRYIVKITVVDERGKKLKFAKPLARSGVGALDDLEIKPGGFRIFRSVDITDLYGWRPGRYTIDVLLEGWSFETLMPRYWTGRIKAEPLRLSVTRKSDWSPLVGYSTTIRSVPKSIFRLTRPIGTTKNFRQILRPIRFGKCSTHGDGRQGYPGRYCMVEFECLHPGSWIYSYEFDAFDPRSQIVSRHTHWDFLHVTRQSDPRRFFRDGSETHYQYRVGDRLRIPMWVEIPGQSLSNLTWSAKSTSERHPQTPTSNKRVATTGKLRFERFSVVGLYEYQVLLANLQRRRSRTLVLKAAAVGSNDKLGVHVLSDKQPLVQTLPRLNLSVLSIADGSSTSLGFDKAPLHMHKGDYLTVDGY